MKIHWCPNSNEAPRTGQSLLQQRRPFLAGVDSRTVVKNRGPLVQSIAQLRPKMWQQIVVHPRARRPLVKVAQEYIPLVVHGGCASGAIILRLPARSIEKPLKGTHGRV